MWGHLQWTAGTIHQGQTVKSATVCAVHEGKGAEPGCAFDPLRWGGSLLCPGGWEGPEGGGRRLAQNQEAPPLSRSARLPWHLFLCYVFLNSGSPGQAGLMPPLTVRGVAGEASGVSLTLRVSAASAAGLRALRSGVEAGRM